MKQQQDALRTLLQAASFYVTEKIDLFDAEQRTAIAAAISRGCTVELRIAPLSQHRVRLVLIGGAQELELGHLQDAMH